MSDFSAYSDTYSDSSIQDESLNDTSKSSLLSKNETNSIGEVPLANQKILTYLATIGKGRSAFEAETTTDAPPPRRRLDLSSAVEEFERQEEYVEEEKKQQRMKMIFFVIAILVICGIVMFDQFPKIDLSSITMGIL